MVLIETFFKILYPLIIFFSNSLVLDTERAKQFVAPLTMTADSIGISNGSARFISGLSTELFNKCYFLIADDKQVKLRKFYENILGMLCVKNSNCLTFYLSTHRQHLFSIERREKVEHTSIRLQTNCHIHPGSTRHAPFKWLAITN